MKRAYVIGGALIAVAMLGALWMWFSSDRPSRTEEQRAASLPPYDYTPEERVLKEALLGVWFRPYTEPECATILEEGNAVECIPGIDGHTEDFPKANDVELMPGQYDGESYCGWDVRGTTVVSICTVPYTMYEVYIVESVTNSELVLRHPDQGDSLRYKKIIPGDA